jgi:hypothetical protein
MSWNQFLSNVAKGQDWFKGAPKVRMAKAASIYARDYK